MIIIRSGPNTTLQHQNINVLIIWAAFTSPTEFLELDFPESKAGNRQPDGHKDVVQYIMLLPKVGLHKNVFRKIACNCNSTESQSSPHIYSMNQHT